MREREREIDITLKNQLFDLKKNILSQIMANIHQIREFSVSIQRHIKCIAFKPTKNFFESRNYKAIYDK